MEHWWDDADKRKTKYTEKSLSHCNIVHLKFYTDWPRIKLGLPQSEAGGYLSLPRYGLLMFERWHLDTVMFQQFKFPVWATEISYGNCLTLRSLALM